MLEDLFSSYERQPITRPTPCPQCGYVNEGNTRLVNAPRALVGEISVCWHCFGVSVFVANGCARLLTKHELDRIPDIRDTSIKLARASVARVMSG